MCEKDAKFNGLAEYERCLTDIFSRTAEAADERASRCRWSERHLQCVWFNDKLRPSGLVTSDGEPVEVESAGRWNLEAGPDFLDATLIVGLDKRRIQGDIEIHVRPSDWNSHGHAGDVRYSGVIAHVTYYDSPPAVGLPAIALSLSLRHPLAANPDFSFDDIDISAYPHSVIPATPRPCQITWGSDIDKAFSILRAAGLRRLELKRLRAADLIASAHDSKQALYETVMSALGYKRNAQAFRMLAEAFPLSDWSEDIYFNYALLLGHAGLLPDISQASDPQAAAFSRTLWDIWWRTSRTTTCGDSISWRFDSSRPFNHPIRRLAGAAALFTKPGKLETMLADIDLNAPDFAMRAIRGISALAVFPELSTLHTLVGVRSSRASALIGGSCASVIVTNAIIPFLSALHPQNAESLIRSIRPEPTSSPMRAMATRLFGPDHNPAVIYEKSGLRQQGLLQIFNDFCLNSKNNCGQCRFGNSRQCARSTVSPPEEGEK